MSESKAVSTSPLATKFSVFVLSLGLWLALAGSLDMQEIISGGIVALLVTLMFYQRLEIFSGLRFSWLLPVHVLIYLVDFCIALILANLDLARRVLTPSLPIQPEVVVIETQLQSDLGRLLLANTITLTPGTLSVDYEGSQLKVHWVYRPAGLDHEQVTRKIVGRFERHLGRFLW